MNWKIRELHRLITILKNEEGLSDNGVLILEGYAAGLDLFLENNKKKIKAMTKVIKSQQKTN